jgi:putative transposase
MPLGRQEDQNAEEASQAGRSWRSCGAKLRQVDVLTSQGRSVADSIRAIGVTEVTYYRWRQEYGGLRSDQVRRMKDLEAENTRLRRAVSDLTLDKMILAEAARGNF